MLETLYTKEYIKIIQLEHMRGGPVPKPILVYEEKKHHKLIVILPKWGWEGLLKWSS